MLRKFDARVWSLLFCIGLLVFKFLFPLLTLLPLLHDKLQVYVKVGFWVFLALLLLSLVVMGLVGVGLVVSYMQFCTWFDEALRRERLRITQRQRARQGEIIFPESDPMHDPELDGSATLVPPTSIHST